MSLEPVEYPWTRWGGEPEGLHIKHGDIPVTVKVTWTDGTEGEVNVWTSQWTHTHVASIVGSVDGASQLFDRDFRPVSDRARARLSSILVAMRQGEPLPPIEVWQWRGEYYVLDGHHRVAAARRWRSATQASPRGSPGS